MIIFRRIKLLASNKPVNVVGMFVLHRPVCNILSRAAIFWKIIATAAPSASCEESQHDNNDVQLSVAHCLFEYTASCNVDAPRAINYICYKLITHIIKNSIKRPTVFFYNPQHGTYIGK